MHIIEFTCIDLYSPIGEPNPPFNLILTLPPSGLGVLLSWERGYAFETVRFVITSLNTASLSYEESFTNEASISLTPTPGPMGRTCPLYEFTVQSENDFNCISRSRLKISQQTLIPTGKNVCVTRCLPHTKRNLSSS